MERFARTASVLSDFECGGGDEVAQLEDLQAMLDAWRDEIREIDAEAEQDDDDDQRADAAPAAGPDPQAEAAPAEEEGEVEEEWQPASRTASWEAAHPLEWVVESVVACRRRKGVTYYCVSWKDCDLVTWEPEEELECKRLIREFHAARRPKPAPAALGPRRERARARRLTKLASQQSRALKKLLQQLRDPHWKALAGGLPQSLRGLSPEAANGFLRQIENRPDFKTMLGREAEHSAEYAVFYHSYSIAALLYETHTCIALRDNPRLPRDFAPLPRLHTPMGDFSVAEAQRIVGSTGQRDHDVKLRSLMLSASLSLFATRSEAPPLAVFDYGYSCTDVSFQSILEAVLSTVGAVEKYNDVVALGTQYGLNTAVFGGGAGAGRHTGHLLQIFVHRSAVDRLAYPALAYGLPDPVAAGKKCSEFLAAHDGVFDGQARVLALPAAFTNAELVRLYGYHANGEFGQQRAEFQRQLAALIFGS